MKSTAQTGKGRKPVLATGRRNQRGEGSSKSIPEDIIEPKCWELDFMGKVQPVFINMVNIQQWRPFLTPEGVLYPELVRQHVLQSGDIVIGKCTESGQD